MRCTMCGSADWEWEADPFAYEAVLVECRGCKHKEELSKASETRPGVTAQLAPTKGPEADARREREQRFREMIARDRADERAGL